MSGKYDLEERTLKYAEKVIDLAKSTRADIYNESILKQLIRSSGSVGANYSEANEAESKKDFIHKVRIAKKEVKETKHWLRLLHKTNPNKKDAIDMLIDETRQLLLIFSKIVKSSLQS